MARLDVVAGTERRDPLAPASPTRVRHRVVGFAVTLAAITYVDRVCISQAAPYIVRDLGLSAAQMGLAFSAFALAYAIFEIPGGWLADRIGPRKVLMRIVIAWSVCTAATGYAWNAVTLVITRFLFGAGEAGCFPSLTKAFMLWLPSAERTRAQAIMWLSARWAGALTPLAVIWVMTWLSWRNTFVLFGAMGVVWAVWFYRSFHDRPQDDPRVNAAERALIEAGRDQASPDAPIPWAALFRARAVWLLWIQYICLNYGWFFYVTWLPTYLRERVGVEIRANPLTAWLETALSGVASADTAQKLVLAALAGIPLLLGGFGCIACGLLTPRLIRWLRGTARARRTLAWSGFTGASLLLIGSYYLADPLLAMLAMGAASFCNDLTMPGSWSTCMDLGGRFAGTLAGTMNMMGAIGAAVAPLAIGLILDATQRNWAAVFWLSGIMYFLGGLCWWWLDPVTPLESREPVKP